MKELSTKKKRNKFFAVILAVIVMIPVLSFAKEHIAFLEPQEQGTGIETLQVGDIVKPGDTIRNAWIRYYDYEVPDGVLADGAQMINEKETVIDYPNAPTRVFLGWVVRKISVECGGASIEVKVQAVEAVKSDLYLSYDGATGDVDDPNFNGYYFEGIEGVTLPEFNPKEGYDFDGWFLDEEYTEEVTEIPADATGKLSIYAKVTPKDYSVTYELGASDVDNKDNPATYTHSKGAALKDPTRDGYSFLGWYTDEELTKKVSEIAATSVGSITLYASWEEDVEEPETPTEPETPAEPEEPAKPETPAEPEAPTATPDDAEPTEQAPATATPDDAKPDAPKTGDNVNVVILMMLVMTSAGAFVFVKKRNEQ